MYKPPDDASDVEVNVSHDAEFARHDNVNAQTLMMTMNGKVHLGVHIRISTGFF